MTNQILIDELEMASHKYEMALLKIIDIATRTGPESSIVRLGLIVDTARDAFK